MRENSIGSGDDGDDGTGRDSLEVHSVESPFVLKFRHAMPLPSSSLSSSPKRRERELQKRARWVS